jgi:hypothetical protein
MHPINLALLIAFSSITMASPVPAQEQREVGRISVEELKGKLARNEPVVIIVVRSEGSYNSSDKKIKGAIRMKLGEIARDR